ncbi:MAG: copper amine oxidase N-terminal domain-containing protein [Armatimonadetes bacterium]|nr:copper amine oxidase N-terminal domain-containing protein [Armatimonadota bacterium]
MQKRTQRVGWVSAALLLGAVGSAGAAPAITVTVNGTPVAFTGTPPTEIKGAVLVPLRGVFQALNATVNYNPVTKVINAQKGSASVVLPLGAQTATVNGRPEALSQPAQSIGGTTLVPLRFVAQALGAYVQWHAATSTVEIKTAEPHLATLPPPPGTGPVEGLVTGVYTDTVPQTLTVRVNGQNTSLTIATSTILLRSEIGQPAMEVPLGQIIPGDEVRVQRDTQGNVVSVTATFGEVAGTVKSIGRLPNGDPVITLNDGKTIELTPNAPVTSGGRRIALSDIMSNEKVVIRTNPSNSLGTGVALATGDNPNPTPPGNALPAANLNAPTVTSFTQDARRPLHAGDVLTATLTGTSGGQASFTIPGVVENVPMREGANGVYTGSFTVPRNVSVAGAAVLGEVVVNGVSSPLVQASGTVTVDSVPPKVTDFSPADGATVESDLPLVYATVSDAGGTGVDPNATRLAVDGADVTGQATVTPAFVSYKPAQPLPTGRHTARLTLADRAGNTATSEWAFTVSTSKIIQAFTGDAPSGNVTAGTTVHFTLTAQPGGEAAVSIGSLAKDVPLSETQSGVYTGAYTVQPGENARNAPVTATFVARDGTKVTSSLRTDLTVAGGAPAAPVITDPADGAQVGGDPLTVSGTAAPGATVRVKVDFSGKALGGLLPISGSVGGKDVTADRNGRWTAPDLPLRADTLFGGSSDTTFTVTATAVDSNGDESPAATVHVRRK